MTEGVDIERVYRVDKRDNSKQGPRTTHTFPVFPFYTP